MKSQRYGYIPRKPRFTWTMGNQVGYEIQCERDKNPHLNYTGSSHKPSYTLNGKPVEQVAGCCYLRVTFQAEPRFTKHIERKIKKAKKPLGMIKHALYFAPQKVKLIA